MFSGRSVVLVAAVIAGSWSPSAVPQVKPGGYILERDAEVAKAEPGTHKGAARRLATRSSPRRRA